MWQPCGGGGARAAVDELISSTTARSYLGKWSKSSNRLEVRWARRPNKRSKMANIVVDDFILGLLRILCRLVSNVVYFNKCVFIAVLQSKAVEGLGTIQ